MNNGGRRESKHYLIVACGTCGYMGNLVSVEEKGCFWIVSDSHKDRRKGGGGCENLVLTIGDNNEILSR